MDCVALLASIIKPDLPNSNLTAGQNKENDLTLNLPKTSSTI